MKANVLLPAALGLALLSACAPKPPAPAPTPPRPVATTVPVPQPAPRPAGDWRDVPLTPGGWTWSNIAGRSMASFGQPGQSALVTLTCITPGTIQLAFARSTGTGAPAGVITTSGTFPLMSDPAAPGPAGATITLAARAPVLDAMAFSRGRFVIELPGQAAAYIPTRPEIARTIEDCR